MNEKTGASAHVNDIQEQNLKHLVKFIAVKIKST